MSEAVFAGIRAAAPAGCMITDTTWNGAAFVGGLVNLYSPFRVIEVGACRGFTSAYIARSIRDNGVGHFTAFELDVARAYETSQRLEAVWPGGSWAVANGDFFAEVTDDPIDFAFIDIDPKSLYLPVYERLKPLMVPGSVIVAHDLDYEPPPINGLRAALVADGWGCLGLHKERGFLVAVKS
jgi:predicted O-methyltransferase YrrM